MTTQLDSLRQEVNVKLQGEGKTLLFSTLFGSHKFGLNSANSDLDLFAVYTRPKMNYVLWGDAYAAGNHVKLENGEVQLMDVKRWFELAERSNFTVLASLYDFTLHNGAELPMVGLNHFDYKRVVHHLLGLVHNPKQRTYMSVYSWMLAEYLVEHKFSPVTLDAFTLLDKCNNLSEEVRDLMMQTFLNKKNGVKSTDVDYSLCTLTHDYVNTLEDRGHSDVRRAWTLYWSNSL